MSSQHPRLPGAEESLAGGIDSATPQLAAANNADSQIEQIEVEARPPNKPARPAGSTLTDPVTGPAGPSAALTTANLPTNLPTRPRRGCPPQALEPEALRQRADKVLPAPGGSHAASGQEQSRGWAIDRLLWCAYELVSELEKDQRLHCNKDRALAWLVYDVTGARLPASAEAEGGRLRKRVTTGAPGRALKAAFADVSKANADSLPARQVTLDGLLDTRFPEAAASGAAAAAGSSVAPPAGKRQRQDGPTPAPASRPHSKAELPLSLHLHAELQSPGWQQGYAAGKKELEGKLRELEDENNSLWDRRERDEEFEPNELAEKNELVEIVGMLQRAVAETRFEARASDAQARVAIYLAERDAWDAQVALHPDDVDLRADEPVDPIVQLQYGGEMPRHPRFPVRNWAPYDAVARESIAELKQRLGRPGLEFRPTRRSQHITQYVNSE